MRRGVLSILAVGAAAALAWLVLDDRFERDEPSVTALVRESPTVPEPAEPRLQHPPEPQANAEAAPPGVDPTAPTAHGTTLPPAAAEAPGSPEGKPDLALRSDAEAPAETEPTAAETEQVEVAALPPAEDTAAADPAAAQPAAEAEEVESPPEGAPVFDLVRVAPDGQVVVAGRAEPGARVEVVVEGEVAGEAEADPAGAFVAVLETGPSAEPREMILRVEAPPDSAADGDGVTPGAPGPAAQEPGPEDEAEQPVLPAPRYLASAPVVILPSSDPVSAPVVVRTDEAEVDVVQPAPLTPGERMALDRITYEAGGDVIAAGRGEHQTAVRAYANGILVSEAAVADSGGWRARIPSSIAADAELLRFDSVSAGGRVTSRIETPFDYDADGADLAVRERQVIIQRGNNLWRLAEQHYGAGIRYSLIFSANSELIRDPDLIYPGQVFTVPELVDSE